MHFVDTNILLYAASTAEDERSKRDRSLDILDRDDLALSVQVLQEFYVQATRTTRESRLEHQEALALIESWLRFRVEDVSVSLMRDAFATSSRWQISYWDAAIVEAARAASCGVLYSEDLQHGMDFAGVRVENPYR